MEIASASPISASRPRSAWSGVAVVLLVGYLCMGRSFAYWGIPPLHIFVGEIVLAWFVLSGPRVRAGRWLWRALKTPSLLSYTKPFLVFLAFGIFEVVHGIVSGHPSLDALRDLAFNYYPLYFFLGLWIGARDDRFLPGFFRIAAWINGIYGVLFILLLSNSSWFFPGVSQDVAPVPIFGQPSYSAAILLGLLSYEKNLRRVWPLLFLNTVVMLGMLIRAEWVAFGIGVLVWAWLTRNLKRVALAGLFVLLIFVLMYVTSFSYQGPETRGGTISVDDLVGRVIAPFNSDLASDYTSDVQLYEGTTVWRAVWWLAIWNDAHQNYIRALLGHGYGFPLNELVPYLKDSATRTPHNVFFYALGYTGWIGVLVFTAFQAVMGRLLWRAYRKSGQPFGIVFWASMLAFALFTPFFETPQGAIPFYLVSGCAYAAAVRTRRKVPAAERALPGSSDRSVRRSGSISGPFGTEATS
jgi:hypothetical protein